MKKISTLLISCLLLFSSCSDYDDVALWNKSIDVDARLSALEELCNQMNTNISSLQTIINALQDNDYVKSVTPVIQDGKEIGYTITFSKSSPITIYHGKDGSDGADGEDGSDGNDGLTPVIGVRQDTDGIYYWTLNGEWLTDSQGNKIKAQGTDGSDGSDGADGDSGKDGITPKFKIENGYWYVSYDNESSWLQLGKATGENGSDGSDGDSLFESVTQDDDNVYFKLSNGTLITIPQYKELTIVFSQQVDIPIRLGKSVTVTYSINGGGSNPLIETMVSDDGWRAEVTAESAMTGSITITCAQTETQAKKVVVFVSDGKGRTTMATLTFVYDVSEDLSEELYIPDPNFKAYLLTRVDMDGNGILTKGDAMTWNNTAILRSFNIPNYIGEGEIESLEGIEYFTALEALDCTGHKIKQLDVSKNTALTSLSCSSNQLTSLDVSKNTALTSLSCSSNQLTSLDVSKNTALTDLDCSSNQLTSLDVSKNAALEILKCSSNQLTSLDVSKNTALTELDCSCIQQLSSLNARGCNQLIKLDCHIIVTSNRVVSLDLDISGCTSLLDLNCSCTRMTKIDLTTNTALEKLSCFGNQLTSLDVSKNTALTELVCSSNQLTNLDVSKNTSLTKLECSVNNLVSLDVSSTDLGNSDVSYPLKCAYMSTLQTLYLKTGWNINGITDNRSREYIPEQTEILYKD